MTASLPSWSIVATVDEPPALVQTFVAWHLHLGAETIFAYCDRPDDPVADMLAHLPQVQVIRCDSGHWQRLGQSRPLRHENRQVANACDAYRRCPSDWLLHCDADEFLWPRDRVGTVLAAIAKDEDAALVQVAERMHRPDDPGHSVFEGAFRRPFRKPPQAGLRLFGPDYALTSRGLTGHALGKAFVRTDRSLAMSIHRPQPLKGAPELRLTRPSEEAITLLHFDGLTPAYWIYKLARMQHALINHNGMPPSDNRRAQADALMQDPDQGAALYFRLKLANSHLQAQLERQGLWFAPAFDPHPALAAYFPKALPQVTPEALDAWLVSNKSQILSFIDARR